MHSFKMITFPCPFGHWTQMCKGKGKGKCKGKGKGKGKTSSEELVDNSHAQVTEPIAQEATEQCDMVFTVEVEDGRQLTIASNKDEVPKEVAQKFAVGHGIAPDELSTIEDFVMQAHATVEEQDAQHVDDARTHSPEEDFLLVDDALTHLHRRRSRMWKVWHLPK